VLVTKSEQVTLAGPFTSDAEERGLRKLHIPNAAMLDAKK